MAISFKPKGISELVKLVSIQDDAIDWERSYTHINEDSLKDEDDNLEKARMREHREQNDAMQLAYKGGASPTVFVFHNPKLVEWNKKLTSLEVNVQSGNKKAQAADMWFEAVDMLLIGTSDNFVDEPTKIPRDKHTKKIDSAVMQALVEQSVVMEFGTILLSKAHESNVSERQKK